MIDQGKVSLLSKDLNNFCWYGGYLSVGTAMAECEN